MAFRHMPLDARLLLGCHDLPLPGPHQVLHSLLNRICLRDQQIGASSELDKAVEGTGITCENDYAGRRVEAIGIGFVLSRSSPFVESEMGIFDYCHLVIGILLHHSVTDVMTID